MAPEIVLQVSMVNTHKSDMFVHIRREGAAPVAAPGSEEGSELLAGPEIQLPAPGPSEMPRRVPILMDTWTHAHGLPACMSEASRALSSTYRVDWRCRGEEAERSGSLWIRPSLFEQAMAVPAFRQQIFPCGVVSMLGASLERRGRGPGPEVEGIGQDVLPADSAAVVRSALAVKLRALEPLAMAVRVHNRTGDPKRCSVSAPSGADECPLGSMALGSGMAVGMGPG